jgi:phosphate transport system substrate-binding protein
LFTKKWIAEYAKTGVQIDYTSSGSGDGIAKMIDGQNDFGCTDAPMNDEEIKRAGGKDAVIHVPLVMGAVVPIYNLEDIKELKFTGPVLADIYLGKIKRWNEGPIQKLNPDAKLPDLPITTVHRADGSGTSFIFTSYLCTVSKEWEEQVGKGTNPKWKGGVGGQKNPGVAELVKATKGAIGYVELIYALQNKGEVNMGVVRNADDTAYVTPSLETVTAAAASLKEIPDNLCISIVSAPGKDSYPISGTTWAVAKVQQPAGKAKALADFLHWAIHDGQKSTGELHYASIPQRLVELADKKIDLIK